jgi:amino-acid N-acetyltransferase
MAETMDLQSIIIESAQPEDAYKIPELLAPWVAKQIVLPRTPEDILEHLENFLVARFNGSLVGVVAARDFGDGLNEVRSLAVASGFENIGLGSALVQAAIALARKRHASRIFALTMRPRLFQRMGFKIVDKELFPQKVWLDCSKCPKRECCDEVAVSLELK